MTYYKDFTVCHYFNTGDWLCRLMAVGWLEQWKPFPRGEVPIGAVERLWLLRQEFKEAFPHILFRGWHNCTICEYTSGATTPLKDSHINLFIPCEGFVFVAPGRIDHYIECHGYQPPESFLNAVLECPSPLSNKYREMIRAVNRGYDPPLYE
jgi:hypothetical protein